MSGLSVRAIRLYHKMSRDEFAERLGVSPSTVEAVENGRRKVSTNLKIKIAQEFEMTDDLIEAILRAQEASKLAI